MGRAAGHGRAHGLRNSLLIAIAPTATIASIAGCYECIEPQVSNLFKRETLSGEFLQVNTATSSRELKRSRPVDRARSGTRSSTPTARCRASPPCPRTCARLFRTAWELPQRALIDMAAARGAYVDQSQSLNLFMASPTIGKLSSMYLYAWKAGLKTTYYLRSRPATRIQQATVGHRAATTRPAVAATAAPRSLACSLENPEAARPASDHPNRLSPQQARRSCAARPRHEPDPAADALPALLRPLPRRHQEHVDRRGGRPAHRPRRPAASSAPAERHLVNRLVAFFATGDTIVANNLVLNLYQHVNAPRRGCTCRGSCSRRRCTSSST